MRDADLLQLFGPNESCIIAPVSANVCHEICTDRPAERNADERLQAHAKECVQATCHCLTSLKGSGAPIDSLRKIHVAVATTFLRAIYYQHQKTKLSWWPLQGALCSNCNEAVLRRPMCRTLDGRMPCLTANLGLARPLFTSPPPSHGS